MDSSDSSLLCLGFFHVLPWPSTVLLFQERIESQGALQGGKEENDEKAQWAGEM